MPPAAPPPASPPVPETVELLLRKKLESKARHSKQNKAMLMLTKTEVKKLVDENRKLKEEVAELRSKLDHFQPPRDPRIPITPRHAIVSAGMHGVHSNDVLQFVPKLVAAYESETGKVAIRRNGMVVCFPFEDKGLVVAIVEQLAPEHLPLYWKRGK
jgi:hypothetical protein